MEPNISGNQSDVIKSRPSGEARIKHPINPSVPEAEHFDYKKDPVYQNQAPASGSFTGSSPNLGDSYEGFKSSSRDAGMTNLGKSDGFGAQFEMPEPGANEQYMGSTAARKPKVNEHETEQPAMPEAFVDFQTSLHTIQDIIAKLRENLLSPEQSELEQLLRQGGQVLQANWKQLSSVTTDQVSGLKDELKENPYRGLIGALKIGMALSQIISSRHSVAASLPNDTDRNTAL